MEKFVPQQLVPKKDFSFGSLSESIHTKKITCKGKSIACTFVYWYDMTPKMTLETLRSSLAWSN